MRVIHSEVNERLNEIAYSICKDARSWSDWVCFCLRVREPYNIEEMRAALFNVHIDGNAYLCGDNNIIIICRNQMMTALYDFIHEPPFAAYYDRFPLSEDWSDAVSAILKHVDTQSVGIDLSYGIDFRFSRAVKDTYPGFEEVFLKTKEKHNSAKPLKILLVEDDPVSRRLVSNAFKKDYQFVTAKDAYDAINQYMTHAPDIVFLDIDLPGGTGYSVLHEIKQRDADATVVMFSAHSYIDSIVEAAKAGAEGFIPKPFQKDRLLHYVTRMAA